MLRKLVYAMSPSWIRRRLDRLTQRVHERRYLTKVAAYPRHTVEHSYSGYRLKVMLGEEDGAAWYDHDWAELPMLPVLRTSRLRAGSTVFDLGAHQGVVALVLAGEVGPDGRVVAVDPNELNCELATRNAALNDRPQMHVRQAAVGDRSGVVRFGIHHNDHVVTENGKSGGQDVRSVTIDELAAEFGNPDVVFMDVEGYECHALAGASRTLRECRTDWFVEIHHGCGLQRFGKTPADVLAFFPPARYRLFLATEEEGPFAPLEGPSASPPGRCFLVALDQEPDA